MCGVAQEDFVRMDAEPLSTQAPCDVTSNGRGEHGDDNQIDTGANLECAGRYARTAPRRYGREAHASTERKENESQSGSSNWPPRISVPPRVGGAPDSNSVEKKKFPRATLISL